MTKRTCKNLPIGPRNVTSLNCFFATGADWLNKMATASTIVEWGAQTRMGAVSLEAYKIWIVTIGTRPANRFFFKLCIFSILFIFQLFCFAAMKDRHSTQAWPKYRICFDKEIVSFHLKIQIVIMTIFRLISNVILFQHMVIRKYEKISTYKSLKQASSFTLLSTTEITNQNKNK